MLATKKDQLKHPWFAKEEFFMKNTNKQRWGGGSKPENLKRDYQ